ncbi:MAG: hypothetical protein NUW01_11590, partial [Gemmatimonadaceae bacterium]|nr:hypothetical protein [Gemmatimonadaceae bacterium]
MDFGKLPFLSGRRGPDLPVIGEQRQQLVDTAHGGPWYQAAREGRVFIGNAAAAGSVLPIYSNTTQVFGVWNPKGSGVNVIPISLALCYVSTTGAAGGYCLALVRNTGAGTATAGQG